MPPWAIGDASRNHIGHNYMGHDYIGHDYIGDDYIGHNLRPDIIASEPQLLTVGLVTCGRIVGNMSVPLSICLSKLAVPVA